VRLNKYISETGVCSRREADKLIEAKRVTCNGSLAVLGTQVGEADEVRLDGRLLGLRKKQIYIALNKPAGITDLVGHQERIFPIGRLDKESEGLILLTNDGDIVNEILRSENNHEKEYLVTVERAVTDLALKMMADGVKIMGEITKPCKVSRVNEKTFRMILTQGLNRQIRRMCSALGYRVQHLRRVRIINIDLGTLAPGEWRELAEDEVAELLPRRRPASGGVRSPS
jgi:23S rRNA pseudouridine2604 synthase